MVETVTRPQWQLSTNPEWVCSCVLLVRTSFKLDKQVLQQQHLNAYVFEHTLERTMGMTHDAQQEKQ